MRNDQDRYFELELLIQQVFAKKYHLKSTDNVAYNKQDTTYISAMKNKISIR